MKLPLSLIILFFVCSSKLFAAWPTDTSIVDGSWSSSSTWSTGSVPNDTDIIVVNTNVILDRDIKLPYPKGKLIITKKGSLCGDFLVDCNFDFFGPISCKSIKYEGGCGSSSSVVSSDEIIGGNPAYVWGATGCWNIGTGVPARCGAYTMPQAGFIISKACENEPVTFTDESEGSFLCVQWLFPGGSPSWSYSENPMIIYGSPGYDTVTLIVNNSKGSDTIKHIIYINPMPSACCNSNITVGQSVQLGTSNSVACSWIPGTGLSCNDCCSPIASPLATTTYTVTMQSDSGCSTSETITVDVNCSVFVPEAFSPNGDGENDILYVRGDCIKTMQFDVFDRWGNKVFESDDKTMGWDGSYKGKAMNSGSYVYQITATLYDGTTQTKKGNTTLVR